jgi:CheY-like chemotaxis protein
MGDGGSIEDREFDGSPAATEETTVPNVLVVDDSSVDRRLAAGLIERLDGWHARTVCDGGEALAVVVEEPIDIVLTDMQMPTFDGFELVKELRRQFPQIAVVLMTAQGSEEIAVRALQAGAASYVPKRTLATELLPTLRRVMSAASDEQSQQTLLNRLESRVESYALESELSLLMSMSRYLQQTLGQAWSLDKTERMRMGTAIEEALLNALYHGNLEVGSELKQEDYSQFHALADQRMVQSPYRDRKVFVRLELSLTMAKVVVRDEGPGFDPHTLPDPSDAENLDRPCGRGVMLMRSFMSEVHYNEAGNEVTLVKRRFAG